MKTNELKKGQRVRLRNGWEAVLEDNARGNIRLATVHGHCKEMGSIYSHDIKRYAEESEWNCLKRTDWKLVEHTKAQLKFKKMVNAAGF